MFSKGLRIVFWVSLLLNVSLFTSFLHSAFAQNNLSPASFHYREDLDQDGELSLGDVVSLLILARHSPDDPRVDYNTDGRCSVSDVLSLLYNIFENTFQAVEIAGDSWRVLGPGGGGGQFIPTINPADPSNVFVRCDMTGSYVTVDNAKSWRMFNLRTVVQDFEFDPSSPTTVYAASTGLYRSDDNGLSWRLLFSDPAQIVREHMADDHAGQWFETAAGMPPDGETQRAIVKVRVDPKDSDHLWFALSNPWISSPYTVYVSQDRAASWSTLIKGLEGRVLNIFPGTWWDKPEEVFIITEHTAVVVSESGGVLRTIALPESLITVAEGGVDSAGVSVYVLGEDKVYGSFDLGASWSLLNTSQLSGADLGTLAVCETRPEVIYLSCSWYPSDQFGIFKSTDSGSSWSWVYRADGSRVLTNNYTGGWLDRSYGPSWRGAPISLGVSATDADICYATDYGSTIRTLDGGAHWEQVYTDLQPDGSAVSRGLDVTSCYGVHFDPFDSLHIFVSYTDIGAFQSFDGGETWFHAIQGIPSQWRNTCYWVVFDPEVRGRAWSVWSNTHDLPRHKMFRKGFENKYGGVAITQDGCRSWSISNFGLPSSAVCTHIVLDQRSPVDSRTLYVSVFRQGVYKSTDGGKNWTATAEVPGTNKNCWRLALLPSGRLFLLVVRDRQGRTTYDGALYFSDDGGQTWEQVQLPEGVNFPNDLVYDPSDPDRLYLSCWPWMEVGPKVKGDWQVEERGGGLLVSEDGGMSWRRIFREDAHVYAAAVDPTNPSVIYINTFDSAAFRSEDRGESWVRIKGYNFKWGQRPVVDPRDPGKLFLTTFGGGLFYGPAAGVPAAVEDIVNFSEQWRWGN